MYVLAFSVFNLVSVCLLQKSTFIAHKNSVRWIQEKCFPKALKASEGDRASYRRALLWCWGSCDLLESHLSTFDIIMPSVKNLEEQKSLRGCNFFQSGEMTRYIVILRAYISYYFVDIIDLPYLHVLWPESNNTENNQSTARSRIFRK